MDADDGVEMAAVVAEYGDEVVHNGVVGDGGGWCHLISGVVYPATPQTRQSGAVDGPVGHVQQFGIQRQLPTEEIAIVLRQTINDFDGPVSVQWTPDERLE